VPPVFLEKELLKGAHMDVLQKGTDAEVNELSLELFGRILTPAEHRIIQRVFGMVARRSARVAGAIISGALTRVARRSAKRETVAVDGSLFEKYPGYSRNVSEAVRELAGVSGKGVQLKLTKDGSGVGAAVIAAVVS
jgi:hexokinase